VRDGTSIVRCRWPDRVRSFTSIATDRSTRVGTFRFHKRLLYLANSMVDQQIGLEETDDGIWAIHFNTILLTTFDERDYVITESTEDRCAPT
jgi:hypothetical protein